jgi:hypothetical protein
MCPGWWPIAISRRADGFLMILAVLFSLSSAGASAETQSEALSENQIKAGFIFNFTRFVEWPPDAFPDPSAPVVLGVVGEDAVTDLLAEAAEGKVVNGRAVVVKRFKKEQDLRACQILFVGSSEEKHLTQIFEKIKGASVLSVGEVKGFAQAGGVINFFVEENKVKLEINLVAAGRARLKVSAKVIAVARLVTDESRGGRS